MIATLSIIFLFFFGQELWRNYKSWNDERIYDVLVRVDGALPRPY